MEPTFDHLGIYCHADVFEEEIKFLSAALAPLGIKEHFRVAPQVSAMGNNPKKPDLWISAMRASGPVTEPASQIHVGLRATNRNQVDEFYKAAIEAGGKDNGAPGIRSQYHPGYYGAFVITPSGNMNLEVVYHDFSAAGGQQ